VLIGTCLAAIGCLTSDSFITGNPPADSPAGQPEVARGKIRQVQYSDGLPSESGKMAGPMCANGSCGAGSAGDPAAVAHGMPRELVPTSHPPYTVAPPDILYIDALRLIPRPPYRIEALEVLLVNVSDTLPNQPIQGPYTISPEGTLGLGFGYGSVRVGGLTLVRPRTPSVVT
jgi:hypothetical protein